MAKRTEGSEKAIQKLSETLGIDICEETNLPPYEYARGGFEERNPQKNLTRMVKTKRTQRLGEAMPKDWRRWLDAASTDEPPGASDWVTVIPSHPRNHNVERGFRALLPS